MEMKCFLANHTQAMSGNEEICLTCINNQVTRLRAYLQRGINLLHPLSNIKEVADYRESANALLAETTGL